MADWLYVHREGTRLACLDFGGEGLPVLILPGLAGHAAEWAETAGWLTERARVLALDARGQGHSERHPRDVSPAAHVADAAFVIEQLGIGPVVLIGHSLGGQRALTLAAERPELVHALIVADAGPALDSEETVNAVQSELASWPVPFASQEAAVDFFGGTSLTAEMWANGLEQHDDGYRPRFELELMVRTLREANANDYWEQWQAIRCPTLIVRATISRAEVKEMAERLPQAQVVELNGAKHDLHLDRPREWRRALAEFLQRTGR